MTNSYTQNGRSMAEVLNEFKEELKDFVNTRIQMLRSELSEKAGAWKMGLPTLIIGLVLMWMALILFTLGLVCVIAMAFQGQPYQYALSFGIVFVLYALAGGALVAYGVKTIKSRGITPERTIRVLKQDQIWLKTEARTQA